MNAQLIIIAVLDFVQSVCDFFGIAPADLFTIAVLVFAGFVFKWFIDALKGK